MFIISFLYFLDYFLIEFDHKYYISTLNTMSAMFDINSII
jgi:hypothetical protein